MKNFNPEAAVKDFEMNGLAKEQFDTFDLDGNGHVTAKELGSFFAAGENVKTGEPVTAPDVMGKEDAKAMIADVDLDGNGTVEFNEFQNAWTRQIVRANLDAAIEKLSDQELDQAVQEADTNRDGIVSDQEFVDWVGGQR